MECSFLVPHAAVRSHFMLGTPFLKPRWTHKHVKATFKLLLTAQSAGSLKLLAFLPGVLDLFSFCFGMRTIKYVRKRRRGLQGAENEMRRKERRFSF
jgi:hypothetical protein